MGLTELLATQITNVIAHLGYPSVFIFMVLESMVFPVPSEAVMPFAGFLIATKQFSLAAVILVSTLGSLVGSLISYAIGLYGGRPFIDKYGKYFCLNHHHLDETEKFFNRYGDITIFVSRFIPIVRHLISLPAGTGEMNLLKFSIYTVIGAGLWNSFLAVVGLYLKNHWERVMQFSHIVDILVIVMLVGAILYFILKRKNK